MPPHAHEETRPVSCQFFRATSNATLLARFRPSLHSYAKNYQTNADDQLSDPKQLCISRLPQRIEKHRCS